MESVPLTSFSPSPPGSLLYVHKRSQKRRRVGHWPSHPPERSLPRRPTAEGRTLTLTLTVIPPLLYETFFSSSGNAGRRQKRNGHAAAGGTCCPPTFGPAPGGGGGRRSSPNSFQRTKKSQLNRPRKNWGRWKSLSAHTHTLQQLCAAAPLFVKYPSCIGKEHSPLLFPPANR